MAEQAPEDLAARARAISVIIPAYNRAWVLPDALGSVLSQEPPPGEVIVVDDGSTDGTDELLRSYGDRVVVVAQENSGVSAARNAGVEAATGTHVTFLDSDDQFLPGLIAEQARKLPERGEVLFSRVAFAKLTPESLTGEEFGAARGVSTITTDSDGWATDAVEDVARGHHLHVNGMILRKETFAEIGGFSTDLIFGEDEDWFFRAALRARLRLTDRPLASRRYHDSMTSLDSEPHLSSLVRVMDRIKTRAAESGHRRAAIISRRRLADKLSALSNHYIRNGKRSSAVKAAARSFRANPSRLSRLAKLVMLCSGWSPRRSGE